MINSVRLGIALLVAQGLAGCGASGRSSMPTAPSLPGPATSVAQAAPAVFAPNVTLSGLVFERIDDAQVPIEGVDVYCEPCGEETHTRTYTDKKGFYSFTGTWGSAFSILVRKEGYQDPPGMPINRGFPNGPGWRDVTIDGDTRFDIELVRR